MKTKKYKLVVAKNQDQKLTDWAFIIKNGKIKYIKVKWKESVVIRFRAEAGEDSSLREGRETS